MPATTARTPEPMVSARNGCSFAQTMSTTMTAMPMTAATTSRTSLTPSGAAVTSAWSTVPPCGSDGSDGFGRVERVQRAFDDVGGWDVDDDRDAVLGVGERLERRELRREQRGRHEVAGALGHAVGDEVARAGQVQEADPPLGVPQ